MKLKGRPVPKEERSTWSLSKLVIETKKLIRTDPGGKDAIAVILKKARAVGLNWNEEDAQFAVGLVFKSVEGCRKRVKHNFDMLLERFNGI